MRRIDWSEPLPRPERPVDVAIIGAGHRANHIYGPLWETMRPWVRLVAVCDPVRAHAESYAAKHGCRAYTSIRELVRDRVAEAAIAVTPPESHASIATFLASHQVHCLVETPLCMLPEEARMMVETA